MRKQVLHPHTAAINLKQKNLSKKAKLDALNWLACEFPHAFDNRLCIRPLSLGIMEEILQQADRAALVGISKSKLREAVVIFTRRVDYLACLKAREMRINLHGHPTDMVSDEDAERAAVKIRKRIEKSMKNARRVTTTTKKTPQVKHAYPTESSPSQGAILSCSERQPMYQTQAQSGATTPRVASVMVKHKQARQYDPDLVARLKEKLGISRRADESEDIVK